MGKRVLTDVTYEQTKDDVTRGGTQGATDDAEKKAKQGILDPSVDPKGMGSLGPTRLSLNRFEKQGDLWVLTTGTAIYESTVFDGTGSMGGNVDIAFGVLPMSYGMLAGGSNPLLKRYDLQISTAVFNDVDDLHDDSNAQIITWTQFEMDEKIALSMAKLVPGRNGCGNGKEDSQFAIFGAAYLVKAVINAYGLKGYHFVVSDEPVEEKISYTWLKKIYGEDVLDHVKANGHKMDANNIPDTAKAVMALQDTAHAFFLQVARRSDVSRQWRGLYGAEHFVMLPRGTTDYLHYVEAIIIGLTEGVLDLKSAINYLCDCKVDSDDAKAIVDSVAHIPLRAQVMPPNFDKLPKAGDLFREKTDLWPVDPSEAGDNATTEPTKKKNTWKL